MSDVRIRPARADDAPALTSLKEEWARLPTTMSAAQRRDFADHLSAWLDSMGPALIARVAEVDDVLVGMAWLVVHPRVPNVDELVRETGDVQNVFVQPAWRRRGIARALVESLLDAADARGIPRVTVSANPASVSVYRALGFVQQETLLERRAPR